LEEYFNLPSVNPEVIITLRDSSFAADLFITAVSELDFFTWLKNNPSSLQKICSSLNLSERPTDVMLTLFKSYNFAKEEQNIFYVTDVSSNFLNSCSVWDFGAYVKSLKDRPICKNMLEVLKTGKPSSWSAKKEGNDWATSMNDDKFAQSFSDSQNSRGAYLAVGLANKINLSNNKKLLDIGGSTGIYTAILIEKFPHLFGTVFEKNPVDRITKINIEKFNLSKKINVIEGDMFSDALPHGYDTHLLSHVIHDWDIREIKVILQNSFNSLESGGKLIIHDAHINELKNGPISVAEYSVLLMFSTEGKCYSINELKSILKEIGFKNIDYQPTIINRSIITAIKD
jgi:precorrin-6B methylase 2